MTLNDKIDKIWQEELKNFNLDGDNIFYRYGGYPKDFASNYIEVIETDKVIIQKVTIDRDVTSLLAIRRIIRHELWHSRYYNPDTKEYTFRANEFFALLSEFLPLEKVAFFAKNTDTA